MKQLSLQASAAALTALMAGAAQAHTGHGVDGLGAGLAHPFMGPDHLLAMVAVGLWSAAVLPGGRRWQGPVVFVGMLLAGALLALAGVELPAIEAGVALSVALLGGLLIAQRWVSPAVGLAVIGGAALMHGFAHGSELASGHSFASYAAGFMLGSALLHGAGLAAGSALLKLKPWAWQLCAAVIGSSGLLMLATRL